MRCGDFKETYIKDEEIFQSLFVKFCLGMFLLFLLVFPAAYQHFGFLDQMFLFYY